MEASLVFELSLTGVVGLESTLGGAIPFKRLRCRLRRRTSADPATISLQHRECDKKHVWYIFAQDKYHNQCYELNQIDND